jgi:hypothetical protein
MRRNLPSAPKSTVCACPQLLPAHAAHDPTASSLPEDGAYNGVALVFSTSEHGTWSSPRETMRRPSLGQGRGLSEKNTHADGEKDGRCTCPYR